MNKVQAAEIVYKVSKILLGLWFVGWLLYHIFFADDTWGKLHWPFSPTVWLCLVTILPGYLALIFSYKYLEKNSSKFRAKVEKSVKRMEQRKNAMKRRALGSSKKFEQKGRAYYFEGDPSVSKKGSLSDILSAGFKMMFRTSFDVKGLQEKEKIALQYLRYINRHNLKEDVMERLVAISENGQEFQILLLKTLIHHGEIHLQKELDKLEGRDRQIVACMAIITKYRPQLMAVELNIYKDYFMEKDLKDLHASLLERGNIITVLEKRAAEGIDPGELEKIIKNILEGVQSKKTAAEQRQAEYVREKVDALSLSPRIIIEKGEITMGDKYHAGQVGAMGPNAHAHDITFNQVWNQLESSVNLQQLANELSLLRQAMKKEADTPEQDIAVSVVAKAEQAAKTGNGSKVIEHLKSAGKWAFDVATKIGTGLAVEVIKEATGLKQS